MYVNYFLQPNSQDLVWVGDFSERNVISGQISSRFYVCMGIHEYLIGHSPLGLFRTNVKKQ